MELCVAFQIVIVNADVLCELFIECVLRAFPQTKLQRKLMCAYDRVVKSTYISGSDFIFKTNTDYVKLLSVIFSFQCFCILSQFVGLHMLILSQLREMPYYLRFCLALKYPLNCQFKSLKIS